MEDFFARLVDTSGFPARWGCGTWSDLHGWTHIVSDVAIWAAYTSIPLALTYFVLKRKDMPFTGLFWLFAAFIFSCGSTHLLEAAIFWWPAYRLSALLKIVTALVSWATAIILIRHMPAAMELPGMARVNEELARLARTDELTGLGNRRYLVERLREECARAQRHQKPLSLLLLDIDHFKRVNDERGHLTGDDTLARLGRLLKEICRASDLPGRYGGEEFCLMLPETDAAGAAAIAERLRERVASETMEARGGRTFSITVSVGVAQLGKAGSVDSLMSRADKALYKAKAEGRNRVSVAPNVDSWFGQTGVGSVASD